MKNEALTMLKDLGYTIKSINRHIKVVDSEGNTRVFSTKVLNQALSNPKYKRRIDRTSLYKKNRSNAADVYKEKVICN